MRFTAGAAVPACARVRFGAAASVAAADGVAAPDAVPACARVRFGAAASVAGADGVALFAVVPLRTLLDAFGFGFEALAPPGDPLAADAAPAVLGLDAVRRARGLRAGVAALSAELPPAGPAGAEAVSLDVLASVEAAASLAVAVVAGWAGAAAGPPGSVASPAAGSAASPGPDGLAAPDADAPPLDEGAPPPDADVPPPDADVPPPDADVPLPDEDAPPPEAGACMDSGSLMATVGASGPEFCGPDPLAVAGGVAGPPAGDADGEAADALVGVRGAAGVASAGSPLPAAAAAAFATSRVRAAPARPRPIRSGRVEGSAPSTLFSAFFGFAAFFFGFSGFSAIRCECTVRSGHGARSPSDRGQETIICARASYAVVAA